MSKKEKIEWDDWGVQATMDEIPHQLNPYNCPHCNYDSFRGRKDPIFWNYIVGFSSDCNRLVMECPRCFKKFWCHFASESRMKLYTTKAKEQPDYFKVPGACEELSKMIEKQKKKK